MIQRLVARVAIVSEMGASLAGAALGFQLMLSAIRQVRQATAGGVGFEQEPTSAPGPTGAPVVHTVPPPPERPREERRSLVDAVERRGQMDFGASLHEEDDNSLRLVVSVTAGPPRSEVFVNGTRLGLSPYLGDFSCKRGEALRFQIVPQRGPLMTRRARCFGRTVRIRE